MNNSLLFLSSDALMQAAISEILTTNAESSQYGLTLTAEQAKELAETRRHALESNGRIELGGGIIYKLIKAFCDSPYLNQNDYAENLNDLLEVFYYFKNETLDMLSDNELLELMKNFFDSRCGGSVELLQNRDLEKAARNIRYGYSIYYDFDEEEEEF